MNGSKDCKFKITTAVLYAVVAVKITHFQAKVKEKRLIMKKKMTVGEKRERILHYKFRQAKRAKIIPKEMPLKDFRGSEFNEYTTKEVTLTSKGGKEFKRKVRIYVPLFTTPRGVAEGKKPKLTIGDCYVWPSKKKRRKSRKGLRARFRVAVNLAKKLRRERRKAYHETKTSKREVPNVHDVNEVRPLQGKLSGRPKVNVDLA
jgi:hypothetical protein